MRYLIIEKEKGLFLGAFRQIYIFAKGNIFSIVRAPSFDTENEAMAYIARVFDGDGGEYGVIAIDAKDKYVSIIDVIKQGYGAFTHELIDLLPMISESVH